MKEGAIASQMKVEGMEPATHTITSHPTKFSEQRFPGNEKMGATHRNAIVAETPPKEGETPPSEPERLPIVVLVPLRSTSCFSSTSCFVVLVPLNR